MQDLLDQLDTCTVRFLKYQKMRCQETHGQVRCAPPLDRYSRLAWRYLSRRRRR